MKKTGSNKRTLLILIPIALGLISIGLVLSLSLPNSPQNQNSNGVAGQDNDNSTRSIIGNPIDIGFGGGIESLLLDGPEEKVSFRFTAKYSGDARLLAFNLLTGNYSGLSAGLQEDASGNPSGQWLGQPGVGDGQVDANEFMEIQLPQTVPI
ncbi:MAG: hypothetical protein ACREBU_13495, partial [Nitrososphaera sp.]